MVLAAGVTSGTYTADGVAVGKRARSDVTKTHLWCVAGTSEDVSFPMPCQTQYMRGMLFEATPNPYRPHASSWRQPLYLHLDPLWRAMERVLPMLEGRVLDIGCGVQPYRSMLSSRVTEYVGLDLPGPNSAPTVVGTAESLPFENGVFDAVICTQVLEHIVHPEKAFAEIARVLTPNGRCVITVPGIWPTHEAPHDYWRFTRYGVQSLLDQVQIEAQEFTVLGGIWSVVGQMANLELSRRRGLRQAVPFVNLLARWLDRQGSYEDLALAYLIVGRRVTGTSQQAR